MRAEFCASLLATAMEGKTPLDSILTFQSGPNISTARNKIVNDFLSRQKAPWLLMVDTDMAWAPDALDRLIEAADPLERPLTGALCYSQDTGGDCHPTMYELVENGDGVPGFIRYHPGPDDSVVQVSATGAAFLLMHRAALKHIAAVSKDPAAPWFRETALPGAPLSLMGEDMTFCLRAGAAGIPVHVHTGVQVGHVKPVMLGKVT